MGALFADKFETRNLSKSATKAAQSLLWGRSHFIDSDTLSWHHSAVSCYHVRADGLLMGLVTRESDDGYKASIFDIFGTVIDRTETSAAYQSQKECRADMIRMVN